MPLTGPNLVPAGAFTYPLRNVQNTKWFAFLLLPDFTLLAFSAALDPLRIANQLAQKPLYGWSVLSDTPAPVSSSSGIEVGVHATLDDLDTDAYLFVCSGNNGTKAASGSVLRHIRQHIRFGGKVGGICTGAATLARLDLLDDRRFTIHWENQPGFIEAFPDLQPSQHRFERDGDLLTCSGGSASTEMMISIIEQDYGKDFAIAVADMCLRGPDITKRAEQRSSIANAISSRNPRLLGVLRAMYENVETPLTLDELAAESDISRRQVERLFKQVLGEAPAQTYRNIRLDRARSLLMETDLSVLEVAMATGFNSASVFSRNFRERYGETPFGQRGRIGETEVVTEIWASC